ncbi:MAG: hypothetical protein D6701_08355 [Gemmatimonadetes bacterium]|nr:MAG: hypothetical protein D6701_08355 [Gemmatimonadota bacterium]
MRWSTKTALSLAVLVGLAACEARSGSEGATRADTLTRRQRDSIVAEMPIPGASAVGRALRAADSIQSRVDRHDTIR